MTDKADNEHDDCPSGDVRFQHGSPLDHLGGLVFCLFVLTATDQSAYRTRPAMSPPKAKCMTGQGTAPRVPPVFALCPRRTALALPRPASPLPHFYSLQLSVSSCCAVPGFDLSHFIPSSPAVFSEQGVVPKYDQCTLRSWRETRASDC